MWGNFYEYNCAPTLVVVEDLTNGSSYKYKVTITQKAKNINESGTTLYDNTVQLILTPPEHKLEGTYNYSSGASNNTLIGGNKSSTATYVYYNSNYRYLKSTSSSSSFTISKLSNGNYCISSGTLVVENGDNQYTYKYTYDYNNLTNNAAEPISDCTPWTWMLSGNVLTVYGNGEMPNYGTTSNTFPFYSKRTSIKEVIIHEGITSIGQYAFYGCTELKKVTIPSSLISISSCAWNGCTAVEEVHVPSPDAWARVTRSAISSSPFGASNATNHYFFFGNSTTHASTVTFTPELTEIKSYAFYKATGIEDVYLPATISNVGSYAFDCKITRLTTNRTTPAGTSTNSFTFATGDTYLFLPNGATAGYANNPWYKGSGSGNGAKYCGDNEDYWKIQNNTPVNGRYVYATSGTINGINWSLSTDGVLTFTGTGELPEFNATKNSENCIPWYRFRYLVYKAVIGTESSSITSIKNALKWCYALTSVDIKQPSLPEVTEMPTSNFLSEVVEISIPMADLNAEALAQEPWSSMQIQLSEPLVIDETKEISTWSGYNKLAGDAIEELHIIRSLSSSNYNTFCSPVTIPAADIAALLGEDAEVYAFTGVSGNAETGYTFAFSPLESDIVAGVPYLVTPGSTISQIELTNVATSRLTTTPQTVTNDGFSFCGVLAPTNLSGGEYILGDGNLLYKALSGQMKGMRAYFTLSTSSGIAPRVSVKVLNQTDTPTNWEAVHSVPKTQKMLRNGRLLIHRDGKTYDILGNKQ